MAKFGPAEMVKAAWGSDLVTQPPRTVLAAIVAVVAATLIGLAFTLIWPRKFGFIIGVIIWCFYLGFFYVFSRGFYRGEKWSRWVWSSLLISLYLAGMFARLVSVVLLFVPSSNRWFSMAVNRTKGQVAA